MNTAVEYKRPGRNRYGHYKSVTHINQNGVVGHITIDLVWFNGLGWYYAVDLHGWREQTPRVVMSFSKNKAIWRHGKELPLCAQAAESEARSMCEKYGIIELSFQPYVLPRKN